MMTLFLNFIETVFSFRFLNLEIYAWLMGALVITFSFKLFKKTR